MAWQHARALDKPPGALSTSGGTEGVWGASGLSPSPGLAAAPQLQTSCRECMFGLPPSEYVPATGDHSMFPALPLSLERLSNLFLSK